MMFQSGYLVKEDLLNRLLEELNDSQATILNELVLSPLPYKPLKFMQNGWINPKVISISSIKDGAGQLRKMGRNWAFHPTTLHRRGLLVQDLLPKYKNEAICFPSETDNKQMGGWTLLDQNTIVAASDTTSSFPHGQMSFIEDKTPPSRAYLKLYEILTRLNKRPMSGDTCLELGASPGSWTYVLGSLGANIIACDRAPLDPILSKFPNVQYKSGDAFKLTPDKIGPIDWLFSDLICYPDRLLSFIKEWIAAETCKNFICTIKFQDMVSLDVLKEFEDIPGSQIIHLFHNKHELTWSLIGL